MIYGLLIKAEKRPIYETPHQHRFEGFFFIPLIPIEINQHVKAFDGFGRH